MLKNCVRLFALASLLFFALSGCVSKQAVDKAQASANSANRSQQLQQSKQWQIRGKIAFIQKLANNKENRESANIVWRVDEKNKNQRLNLTSYLGINVLSLSSQQGQHVLKVDGEEYSSDNLTQLIYALTGLTLPTQALSFWLKGIPYQASDQLSYSAQSHLPVSMTSYYHHTDWQITYDNYKVFQQLPMATKFTIKKGQLTIIIVIKNWAFFQ